MADCYQLFIIFCVHVLVKHSGKHRGRSEEAIHGANNYGITVFNDGFLVIIGNFLRSSFVRKS